MSKNSYTMTGVVKQMLPLEQPNEKIKKQKIKLQVTVESRNTQSTFMKVIPFEFINDKIDELEEVQIGDKIKISFNINNFEWTSSEGKVIDFLSLQGFRVKFEEKNAEAQQEINNSNGINIENDEKDDLPF